MEPRTIEILEILAESTCLDSNFLDNYDGNDLEYFLLLAYGVTGVERG